MGVVLVLVYWGMVDDVDLVDGKEWVDSCGESR